MTSGGSQCQFTPFGFHTNDPSFLVAVQRHYLRFQRPRHFSPSALILSKQFTNLQVSASLGDSCLENDVIIFSDPFITRPLPPSAFILNTFPLPPPTIPPSVFPSALIPPVSIPKTLELHATKSDLAPTAILPVSNWGPATEACASDTPISSIPDKYSGEDTDLEDFGEWASAAGRHRCS